MVVIINVLGILAGAVVLVMSLVSIYVPDASTFDALLMKNLIFFFGHVFINATIYMAVIGVYEIVPRYTGRPWTISRPFLASWAAVTLIVMAVYPHHLLMDYVMPKWAAVTGQVLSYLSGIPILLVTAYGALVNIHRSGLKWDLPLRLLVFSLFGWAAGVIPAIIDGDGPRQPRHAQHAVGARALPLLSDAGPGADADGLDALRLHARAMAETALDRAAFWTYGVAGVVFCFVFLAAGWQGVPRRFAVHDAPGSATRRSERWRRPWCCSRRVVLGVRLLARLPRASLSA